MKHILFYFNNELRHGFLPSRDTKIATALDQNTDTATGIIYDIHLSPFQWKTSFGYTSSYLKKTRRPRTMKIIKPSIHCSPCKDCISTSINYLLKSYTEYSKSVTETSICPGENCNRCKHDPT